MIPYFILIFLPILSAGVRFKKEDNDRYGKRIVTLFFVLLLALLAFRAPTVGRDLANYRYLFEHDNRIGWNGIGGVLSEPAWFVLNNLIGSFTTNYQWLLAICALISVVLFSVTYRREIEYPVLTISLFITLSTFVLLFSGLRQTIAISLGMIAFEFTRKHKLIPYLLIVFLAFLFHRSAFMLLFMYPLYHVRITRKWLLFVIPIMVTIFIFNRSFFGMLTLLISDIYESSVYATGAYTMLILFVIFCIFSFVIPDDGKLDDVTIGMRNFLLLATVIQMFAPLNSLAMRIGYYYIVFIPLLIPQIIKYSSIRWKQVAEFSKYVMIVFFVAYFFINAPITNSLDTFPYHFFWENTI